MVEALIQTSYLVLPDSDLRVCEVVLAGTVTAANQQNEQVSSSSERLGYCQKKNIHLVQHLTESYKCRGKKSLFRI